MVDGIKKKNSLPHVNLRSKIDDGMMMGPNGNLGRSLESEIEPMLQGQCNLDFVDGKRNLNMYRCGSAPPTVEGSLSAVGSLYRNLNIDPSDNNGSIGVGVLTEEEVRSHPAYLSYYYSHENINPRLPPPLLSKEDWRIAQRFKAAGLAYNGNEDWRKKSLVDDGCSSSLFSMQPDLSAQNAEDELMELRKATAINSAHKISSGWMNRLSDNVIGKPSSGMGKRGKSFADILQERLEPPSSTSDSISHPQSYNKLDAAGISAVHSSELSNGAHSTESLHPVLAGPLFSKAQNRSPPVSDASASAVVAPLPMGKTLEPHLVRRNASPVLFPVGCRVCPAEKNVAALNAMNDLSSSSSGIADVADSLSSLSLTKNLSHPEVSFLQSRLQMAFDEQRNPKELSNGHKQSLQRQLIDKARAGMLASRINYPNLLSEKGTQGDINFPDSGFDWLVNFPRRTSSHTNLRSFEGSNAHYQADNFSGVNVRGLALNGTVNGQSLRGNNHGVYDVHSSLAEYILYMQNTPDYLEHTTAGLRDFSRGNRFGTPYEYRDLQHFQEAYLQAQLAQQKRQYERAVLAQQKRQCEQQFPVKSDGLIHRYYGSLGSSFGVPYQNERTSHVPSQLRGSKGGSTESWHSEPEFNMDGRFGSSLLEELKNNRTRSFELSDVVDHVVELSTDQYGSRFIQQKLETATVEQKTKIFSEIIPHARDLMTDVFGNYVIQKFFEHGTESQRKELANQLIGHVLPLTLQMYGCRVIQKALEVVNVDQQIQMIAELDGSVVKCVRDQNGNHVIQKCIESVPQDQIQCIIKAFFGQAVSLSSHPYGCRVIQRILEHCDGPKTLQIIMDEIMDSVCVLAQNRYGNYVVQHLLQHGKPCERSAIINKLAGQIVNMSQQKFASNVIEKCLTYGSPEERQLLVDEMLGSTDENEPLQAMMKDPFGNYVVQKVLQICDDKNRELILSRIKVHLNNLKQYTYGKHIVSRVEKLITAGEKHMGSSF